MYMYIQVRSTDTYCSSMCDTVTRYFSKCRALTVCERIKLVNTTKNHIKNPTSKLRYKNSKIVFKAHSPPATSANALQVHHASMRKFYLAGATLATDNDALIGQSSP